jgi:hypothetical protein
MTVKSLPIDLPLTDGGTQMRAEISTEVYMDYREKILAGVEFPPIDVFYDGTQYWIADGFHRFYGYREAKKASIPCTIHKGTKRDAILFAVGANASHGHKRSPDDKKNAVATLLNDSEWCKWSNGVVAEKCHVTPQYVGDIRRHLETVSTSAAAKSKDEPRVGKDNKTYKTKPKKPAKTKPQASVTGTPATSTASSPDLPSGGTANRTESGSQDSGDAGECPRGGDHEWVEDDDGTFCQKCKDPEPVKNGPLDFPTKILDKQIAAAKAGELDITALQAKYDTMLNCITQITKIWNEVCADERDGVYVAPKKQRVITALGELRPPIAQARPMKVCTFCKGKGCEKCSGCGWWPRSVVEGLSR